jgi:transcriptional regulator
MYVPEAFKVVDDAEILAFIQRFDFATIVSAPSSGLVATHVPVVVRREAAGLVLAGHFARANSHWHAMDGSVDCLAIFHGPHAYVSPTWYANVPAVPTWNYAVLHAYGKPRFRDDRPFIETVVGDLVHRHEGTRAEPWRIEDQPSDFRDRMLAGIVGFEMPVLRIEAKFKLGQNRRLEDRAGTVAGLEREQSSEGIALAEFMRTHLDGGGRGNHA